MAKILIVDDDLETTKLFEGILKMGKHEATSVLESKNAISTIRSYSPDVILLDIMMAQLNGITLCKQIKSDPQMKHIPIIMVSALHDDGTKRDAANAGANEFISKPVLPKLFLEQIQALLNK